MKPFPLQWPEGLPRTANPTRSRFNTTLASALKNVQKSLEMFGADSGKRVTDIVLSSNVGGGLVPAPVKDKGVAAWFTWEDEPRCIAVDRYDKVEDNLQAIHHVLEARRTELRHGGLNIARQTFRGFTALPKPAGSKEWWEVLGLEGPNATKGDIDEAYRRLAAKAHPDKPGGSHDKMAKLNAAKGAGLLALADQRT
jgi:hypothetical protein